MPGVSTMTTNQGRKLWSLSTSLTSWIPKLRVPTTLIRSTQMERLNYNWLMTSLSESTLEESSLTESKRFSLSFPLSMNSCQFVGKLKMCIMWCPWSRVSSSHWLSSNHHSMSRQGLTKVSDSTNPHRLWRGRVQCHTNGATVLHHRHRSTVHPTTMCLPVWE